MTAIEKPRGGIRAIFVDEVDHVPDEVRALAFRRPARLDSPSESGRDTIGAEARR